jgi:uncharacterized membrane protein YgcG
MLRGASALLTLLLAALALLLPATGDAAPYPSLAKVQIAPQGERIIQWRSDIEVLADGSLAVAETIRVNVEGNQISHGIFRDFPTTYERDGRRVRVGFDVASVTRDGQPEPYETSGFGNGVRVQVGDADVYLDHGVHTYVIRYTTTRQLGFFSGYDELYWNVTGNGWAFPIDRAEVLIRLPQAVPFGPERAFYTGPQGATGHDAEVVSERPGEIVIGSTAPLAPYEGLTVAVRWPKGVVAEPPKPSAARLAVQDQAPRATALAGLLALLGYYFIAWKRAGRGPRAGTVVPLFAPPEDMSAAAVRYVKRMGFDDRCFAAAIVESGVRRELKLVEGDKPLIGSAKTTLVRTPGQGNLQGGERAMLDELFKGSNSIEMDDANHARFGAAREALQKKLEDAYKGGLFVGNLAWAWVGIPLVVAAMLLVATAVAFSDLYMTSFERGIPALGLALMLVALLLRLRGARGWVAWTLGAACTLGGIVLLILSFVFLSQAVPFGSWGWMLAPLLALPLVLSAFAWMAAPTSDGRAVMDRIAGFEQYLSITEEERLEALHPPEKTPELFERFLPYAIALGVENRWADKFASVLAAAAADPTRQGGTFGWYSGSSNAWSNPSRFAGVVGASLASGVASASTAPGSSSGSGGGGSSGGGGGGGGGGGW